MSRAITGSNIGKEVAGILEDYDLPVLTTKIHQRVDYPGTAASGSTVIEDFPRSEGAREMMELSAEIEGLLSEKEAMRK